MKCRADAESPDSTTWSWSRGIVKFDEVADDFFLPKIPFKKPLFPFRALSSVERLEAYISLFDAVVPLLDLLVIDIDLDLLVLSEPDRFFGGVCMFP